MNKKPDLNVLAAFSAIASHGSFRKAADELGMPPSTLSHMMRTLETRLDARLFNRTTRSVALTDAGARLLGRVRPLLREFDAAFEEIELQQNRLSGVVRLNATETAARILLRHVVPVFRERFPEIEIDLVTEGRLVDIVAEGFDAGIRLGETVPQDMIAVRFGPEIRFLAVASPAYLTLHPPPQTPDELRRHACIRHRMPSGKLYRWEFEKDGKELSVDAQGPLTLDHLELMAEAASAGMGIAYLPDMVARPYLENNDLVPVLSDWCPPEQGLCVYYPGHRHVPAPLRAFIDVLKEVNIPTGVSH
ncbi:LysR family transcriptional regulator [Aquisalimonas lutea]|uniref:LysR family transcriptional regulator n=1 Tax=Aquisalimonas lutea TaxID=1327750 RepID=UPI0025B3240F|nr:LysR family transcriptional regulator [Aquisalimonas lutea]MDN3519630.1 LysR family transcriptional regulator [Aquisalimonas lutea]